MPMRGGCCVLVTVMLVCVADLDGQSWDAVRALPSGHRIRVETEKERQTGSLMDATQEVVRIRTKRDGEISIGRNDVRRIYAQKRSRRMRNTLIGTGVGVALGVAMYATIGQLYRNEGGGGGEFLALPIVVGTAVGAAVPTGGMKRIYDSGKKR